VAALINGRKPNMDAEEFFGLLVPVTFVTLWLLESIRPARKFPQPRRRRWLGVGFFVLLALVSTLLPLLIPVDWLERHRLLDGTGLGAIGGTLVGYAVLSFVNYLWHRNVHRFALPWRLFHQIHHSPQYVDMSGSALFHPTEMVVYSLLALGTTTLLLGLDPVAAAATGYVAAFYGMFQHLNVRTPRWLGYFIQRPESHCVHHQRGVHHFNFSDLPLWDMLFGTFRNPETWQGEAGFEAEASRRIGAMLAFRDVNAPDYGPASLGVKDKESLAAV
jgi:sterol desaturase/sphingolipid hydroxylase (fatty acid hydroxylase superfamily)